MTVDINAPPRPTIVLIHGLWLTPKSWKGWIDRYQRAGYNVTAPAWPGLSGDIESIRRNPSALKGLNLKKIVDHYDHIIRPMERPPILIGHSFGGLIVQMLLDRGLGACGVAIDSAQSAGVAVLPLSTIRSTISILGNPFTYNAVVGLSPEKFHYAFTNSLDETESKKVYDDLAVPGPAHVLWEGALSLLNPNAASKVNYRNGARAPLLFIAGGADHLVPAAINRANVKKYRNSTAITDYREFPNRTHFTVGEKGWEEVADFALQWAAKNARAQVPFADVKAAFTEEKPFTTPPIADLRT
ncbi:MAG TPA: alpha/beta fold hydrolase [Gemmatimonadaceae bacterium]